MRRPRSALCWQRRSRLCATELANDEVLRFVHRFDQEIGPIRNSCRLRLRSVCPRGPEGGAKRFDETERS